MSDIIILGIDPGYGRVGYGLIKVDGNRFSHIVHGVIETEKLKTLPYRLNQIWHELEEIIIRYNPVELAIEKLFFMRNVSTAMDVSEAKGVIQLLCYQKNMKIFEYTPYQIKQAVCGQGRAEKGQVQRTLKIFLNLEKTPKPDDAADALATAFCHGSSRKYQLIKE